MQCQISIHLWAFLFNSFDGYQNVFLCWRVTPIKSYPFNKITSLANIHSIFFQSALCNLIFMSMLVSRDSKQAKVYKLKVIFRKTLTFDVKLAHTPGLGCLFNYSARTAKILCESVARQSPIVVRLLSQTWGASFDWRSGQGDYFWKFSCSLNTNINLKQAINRNWLSQMFCLSALSSRLSQQRMHFGVVGVENYQQSQPKDTLLAKPIVAAQ